MSGRGQAVGYKIARHRSIAPPDSDLINKESRTTGFLRPGAGIPVGRWLPGWAPEGALSEIWPMRACCASSTIALCAQGTRVRAPIGRPEVARWLVVRGPHTCGNRWGEHRPTWWSTGVHLDFPGGSPLGGWAAPAVGATSLCERSPLVRRWFRGSGCESGFRRHRQTTVREGQCASRLSR